MAKIVVDENSISVGLSKRDTYDWATAYGDWIGCGRWPCSTVSNKRLYADFDASGLVDVSFNSGRGEQDCDGNEFNAIISDFVKASGKLTESHPCYFVVVEQFDK